MLVQGRCEEEIGIGNMEKEKPKRSNRNGRNGTLTSWKSEAQDFFKSTYLKLIGADDGKGKIIFLDQADFNFLLSCYIGKSRQSKNKHKEIKNFLNRQFMLLGYPKDDGYVNISYNGIYLDFSLNADKIKKELHDAYLEKKSKDMTEYIKNNFSIKELTKKEIRAEKEKAEIERLKVYAKKRKNDIYRLTDSERKDQEEGWE